MNAPSSISSPSSGGAASRGSDRGSDLGSDCASCGGPSQAPGRPPARRLRRTSSRRPRRRGGGFQPPHCPNPECPFHEPRPDWHFIRHGKRPGRDGRRRQRYLCRHCNREFGATAFKTTYWLRKPELLEPIAANICEGSGLRQTARLLGTTHTTVMRHVARLARHCLLTHQRFLEPAKIAEPIVFDGFESFVHSQFSPFHANLAAGSESWCLYYFTLSPLRRKGRMTDEQKKLRAELEARFGRPDPKAVEHGIYGLLKPLLPRVAYAPCRLYSDDHPAYPRALKRLTEEEILGSYIYKITSSKERRTCANDLFPVNRADLLLRHACANHRRETIAFSKRLQAAGERMAIFLVWHNYVKKRREKEPEGEGRPTQTAAMQAGLARRRYSWGQILKRRLFPGHHRLPPEWRTLYEGRVRTLFAGREPKGLGVAYAA